MRKKFNLILMAAVLALSAAVWGAAAAQEATPEATAPAEAEVTPAVEAPAVGEAPAPDTQATRPFLGVALQDSDDGVVIAEVRAGSPADDAGLQAGDMITSVNGTDVATAQDVADVVGALAIGDAVSLEISRGSEALTIDATLGEQAAVVPPMRGDFGNGPRGDGLGRGGRNDMMFGLSYNADDQTWTINSLSENSSLYDAGLREGDVITAVDGTSYDLAGLAAYLQTLEDDTTVTLTVERDGAAQDIDVALSDLGGLFGRGMSFNFDRGNLPEGFMEMMPMFGATLGGGRLGVAFETIDETVATDNDLSVTDGALVQEVVADSPAATAGLLAGDVITAVNGEPVDAERTLRDRMIAYEAGDTVTLTVLRDGESLSIDVTLDEPQYGDMRGMLEQMMPHMGGRGNGFPFGDAQPVPEVTPEAEANA